MKKLNSILTQAGKPALPHTFSDGSRLLLQPSAGRLLGLFPAQSDTNFFWTNPAFSSIEAARSYFSHDGWKNIGGDRTWLAPEIELFVGDLTRPFATYAIPPALDPGNWTLSSGTDPELSLTNATRLQLHRSGGEINVRISKRYRPAFNPISGMDESLQYAGYTQITTVELEQDAARTLSLGIWNLIQLPQPGVMLIPTHNKAQPQVVFGAPADTDLKVTPNLVQWNMAHGDKNAKISLKASALTGRAGYLHQTQAAGIWDLVVREFEVDPHGDYVDGLFEPPHETGWAFQACYVRLGDECFNELEYHSPAVTTGAGLNTRNDESRVWAFRGTGAAITKVAQTLLGTGPGLLEIATPKNAV